jgi:transketolase
VILVGTGTELALAVAAREMLEADGVPTRVVSLPSWFVFEDQPEAYIEAVLPRAVPTVSVEAGTTMGWARYADASIGIDHFGASAPYQRLYEEFGITADAVADAARSLLAAWDEELE